MRHGVHNNMFRVCLVTPDVVGPTISGDAGIAMTALAQRLAKEKNISVTIVYTGRIKQPGDIGRRQEQYRKQGIKLVVLPRQTDVKVVFGGDEKPSNPVVASYLVYQYLRAERFDLVHLTDAPGHGYYSLVAKECGLALTDTTFVVTVHGPTMWSMKANHEPIRDTLPLMQDVMERKTISLADVLISPSTYMSSWLRNQGWVTKRRRKIIEMPNLFPELPIEGNKIGRLEKNPASDHNGGTEFVYWGEIGHRKGISLFLDAVERLWEKKQAEFSVTFIARFRENVISKRMFGLRATRWGFPWKVIDDFDCLKTVDYLRQQKQRIAVIPSLVDNSPYEITACLQYNLPFIATRIDGICEQIASGRHAEVIFAPTANTLCAKLNSLSNGRFPRAKPKFDYKKHAEKMMVFYKDLLLKGSLKAQKEKDGGSNAGALSPSVGSAVGFWNGVFFRRKKKPPLVSVCVLHRDRPMELKYAIASIERQSYRNFEILLYDNGSLHNESKSYISYLKTQKKINVIESEYNVFPAAARNTCVEYAKGEIIKFLDDDNQMRKNELDVFVKAFDKTDYDILTCFLDCFDRTPPINDEDIFARWLFLGNARSMNWLFNCMGDTNFAIRKNAFKEIGGFEEEGILYPAEDWRFLNKAVNRGLKVGVVPEALVYYRLNQDQDQYNWRKMSIYGGLYRVAGYYLDHYRDEKVHDAIHLLQGLFRG